MGGMTAVAHAYNAPKTFDEVVDQSQRAEKVLNALRMEASEFRDGFADIAATLEAAARNQAFAVEPVHSLAARLDAHAGCDGAPGIKASAAEMVCDLRRLIAAHLIIKKLAESERDVRALFGLSPEHA